MQGRRLLCYPRAMRLSTALCLLLLPLAACAGSTPGAKGPLNYSGNAQRSYEVGMKEYQKANYIEATKFFTQVKRRFPYSKYAILAELRIADCSFQREAYMEAIDAYKLFIKFHPTNENLAYSQYQIADAHFLQGPEDWWFLPPSHEKDLSPVVDALTEVKRFIKLHPGSGLMPKAQELLKKVERKLADHELYVARFYMGREKWGAAAGRLEFTVEKYPTLAGDEEVLYRLGAVYAAMGRHEKARLVFQKLTTEKPKNKWAKKVASYLAKPAPKK